MTNFISRPLKTFLKASLLLQLGLFTACNNGEKKEQMAENHGSTLTADENNADLTMPDGFGAMMVADDIGAARHLVVNSEGDIIVKLADVKNDQGIVVLKDTNGDAKVDSISGFGNYGGTGIAMKNGYLYASSNSAVYRYKLNAQELPTNTDNPDTLISGLIDRRQHNSKSITFDDNGNIYVNIGAYSNSCQKQDRTPGSPGIRPCPILD
ncbi:MAG: sorbosone dehydrogenase, partial [Salegentibacter sp.]